MTQEIPSPALRQSPTINYELQVQLLALIIHEALISKVIIDTITGI